MLFWGSLCEKQAWKKVHILYVIENILFENTCKMIEKVHVKFEDEE